MTLNPEDFGASFKGFMDQIAQTSEKPVFKMKLENHFDTDPGQLAIMSQDFEKHEHPNLQVAIDRYLSGDSITSELIGVVAPKFLQSGLGELASGVNKAAGMSASEGPVAYSNVSIGDDQILPCVAYGLYLITNGDIKLAVLLKDLGSQGILMQKIELEVMAPNRVVGEAFLKQLRLIMRKENVYRGRMLSLEGGPFKAAELHFYPLRKVDRDSIILPDGLLDRIEKGTIQFGANAEKMMKWKRHLRRGLLLYGPPGTGKTLTAMYLASAMPGRSIIVITGKGVGSLDKTCKLARALQPSMVIIEDVDLIAENRNTNMDSQLVGRSLLYELMNEMDGLEDDVDIMFLLTTNRPEILEPALASRPGRIDMAFELPLPNADCRRKLFELYSEDLPIAVNDFEPFVAKTEGAAPAFIKELMRTAASYAADEDSDEVSKSHIDEAIQEMLLNAGEMSKRMLGFHETSQSRAKPTTRSKPAEKSKSQARGKPTAKAKSTTTGKRAPQTKPAKKAKPTAKGKPAAKKRR